MAVSERLTLERIGELAGVSRATVSRVINNHPYISEAVRERVLAVIAETGYQPHQAARSLASSRTGLLGLVIPRVVQSLFADPYYPRLIRGISQVCNESGHTLALFIFHTEDDERQLAPQVTRQGFLDGVIIAGSQTADPLIPLLLHAGRPFVVIGEPLEYPEASFVDVANRSGAATAVAHLLALGRRRIATITGRLDMAAGLHRRQGYGDALHAAGLPLDETLIASGDFEAEMAYQATLALLPHQPDAIFAASDSMALAAQRALAEAGVTVPDEIALVGFDDLAAAETAVPPLTTVRQPIHRLGALAVETLLALIEKPEEGPRRAVLPTELIVRRSCGASL